MPTAQTRNKHELNQQHYIMELDHVRGAESQKLNLQICHSAELRACAQSRVATRESTRATTRSRERLVYTIGRLFGTVAVPLNLNVLEP